MQILLIVVVLVFFYNVLNIVKRQKSDREDYLRRLRYEHERSEEFSFGNTRVYNDAKTYNDARIRYEHEHSEEFSFGNTRAYNDAKTYNDARIYNDAKVSDDVK